MNYYKYEITNGTNRIESPYLQSLTIGKSKKTKHPCKLQYIDDPDTPNHSGLLVSRIVLDLSKINGAIKITPISVDDGVSMYAEILDKWKQLSPFDKLFDEAK